jgi:hypothetical protein
MSLTFINNQTAKWIVVFSNASACKIFINVFPFNIAALSIKLIVFARYLYFFQLRNKSWKPECVGSFNMDWRILVLIKILHADALLNPTIHLAV